MKRKKTFVLLELLIAFALVSISILPFLRYPFAHMKEEINALFEMELERAVERELTCAQLLVYQNLVPESQIFCKKKYSQSPFEVDQNFTLCLPKEGGFLKRSYIKKTYIYYDKHKVDQEKTLSSLLTIRVRFYSPKNLQQPIKCAMTHMVAQKKHWVHVEGQ